MLRRSLLKVVIGFALISHGTNLFVTTGKLKRGAVPILVEGYQGPYVDPLPQALILTAIVISFAVTAFMLALYTEPISRWAPTIWIACGGLLDDAPGGI